MRGRLAPGRLAAPVGTAALLGIARLFPETGFGLWLRLAAATLVVLLPGHFVARALGRRSAAATLAWSVALVGFGLAITFAAGASLDATLVFVLGSGGVALGCLVGGAHLDGPAFGGGVRFSRGLLAVAGLALGGAVWFVEGVLTGDSLFHLGRIRKLDALDSLSLHDVGEFVRGGLHPGYAFPLWHGWLALVARLADVNPTKVAVHESSLLVPLALVLAFEMGWAVFRSKGAAFAVVLAQLAIKLLAPGHAGVYGFLWQPGTASTQLFAPAAVALFFTFLRRPSWALALTLAADSAVLSLVHPTYALFLAIPLGAFVAARVLLAPEAHLGRPLAALAVLGVPMGLAFAWLHPIVAQTIAVSPGPKQLASSLHHYRSDLVVHSLTSYNLAPERVNRSGSVVIAALVLAPLAFFARRRRWGALVLGGTVGVLAIELWPLVFPHFSNLVSLSQSRRAAAFVPFSVAFAGGAVVVARRSRLLALALGLGCGIWLQVAYGGDFGLRAPRTVPGVVVWIALYGSAAALAAGAVLAWLLRRPGAEAGRRRGIAIATAALLFVLPVAVHGFSRWVPKNTHDAGALTPGLIRFLQRDVPARSVVFGDLATGYQAVAYAPVYAVAVPPTHAANTKRNQIFKRKRAWLRFLADPTLAIPEHWRAEWIILRRPEPVQAVESQGLRPVYEDRRFVVFRLPASPLP